MQQFAPVSPTERLETLDVLRGFALLGILAMNIRAMAAPLSTYMYPSALFDYQGPSRLAYLFTNVAFDLKMMGLFSMLFGAGVMLYANKPTESGRPPSALWFRRMFVLLAIGLLHAYLLWPGDILVPYALCGILLLWWMRNRMGRTLLISAIAMLTIGAALAVWHWLGWGSMSEADRAAELELMMPTREQALGHVELMLGSYTRFVAGSAPATFMFETMFFVLFFLWRCGGMMLLGMSLYQSGFLNGRLSSSSYARVALIATPVGLGLAFVGALEQERFAYAMPIRAVIDLWNYIGAVFASIGYAAVIIWVVKRGTMAALRRRLAAVGQMALSNYLFHSLTASVLFLGWGLGLAGRFDYAAQLLIVVTIWTVQLIVSPIWLQSFRYGPAEWLWRSLTYGRMQPMRLDRAMRRRLSLVPLLVMVTAGPVDAQIASDGTVRGVIRDAGGGVLPGVIVTAVSPTVPGTHISVSESDGQYRLLNLSPGVFDVVAELAGFTKYTRQGVEVRAGLNLTLDIDLTLGSVTESVIVSGGSPLLETQKPIKAVNIAGDFLRELPLSTRRDVTDVLEATPGVTARTLGANNGTQTYMLRGTDVEQHVVLLDGADMVTSRQGRMETVRLPTDAVTDSQVKTGGADASAPAGLGVVFNVTTRAGTNRLSGTAGVHHQNRRWNADNDPLGVPAIAESSEVEASLGGPIRADRAWFFASYFFLHRDSQISRTPTQLNNLRASLPGWQPFDNRSRHGTGFIKVNAEVRSRHQLHGFFLKPRGFEEANPSTDSRRYTPSGTTGNGVAGRLYSAWTNTLTSTIGASFNSFGARQSLDAYKGLDYGGPRVIIYDSTNTSAGRLVGNGLIAITGNSQNFNVTPASKLTVQADVSWFRTGWKGSHEFQTGVFIQPLMRLSSEANYLNGGFILEEVRLRIPGDPRSDYVPFHRQFVDPSELVITTEKRNSQNYAVYVQDSWKPAPRLTLVAGIRFDRIVDDDELFDVRTQSSLEIGPRAGVIYALTADSNNVVHGSFSRVAAKPEWIYMPSLGGSVTVTTTDTYDTRGDGSFATVLVTPAQTRVAANRRIDPDRHQPFSDEFLLGYRRQLPGQISVDATLIRRAYKDMPAQVDVNGIYTGGMFRGYEDESQNAILLQTNNVWNTPIYTGFEIVGSQRTRRSQFILGYTRGFQHLDGTWQPNDPASFIQPTSFANDRGIGSIRGNENNSLSGTAQARNPMWIKHALRFAASYNAPWGLTLSSNLNIFSGPYTGPIVRILPAPDPQFGPATLVLSNGRTVSNPLATTVRFAYASRGEGQLQAPTLAQWNARVGWRFALGSTRRFDVALSLLNITNGDALQEYLGGNNQIGSPNFAYGPDGTFRGQNRQPARTAQLLLRFEF